MFNSEFISDYLQERGDYPEPLQTPGGGLVITMESGRLIVAGDPCDLIDLADLLVSLPSPVRIEDSTGMWTKARWFRRPLPLASLFWRETIKERVCHESSVCYFEENH